MAMGRTRCEQKQEEMFYASEMAEALGKRSTAAEQGAEPSELR
jgi:hypothetical protein